MRALPVLKDTVDLLVTAAYITGAGRCDCHPADALSPDELDALGQSLWDENHSSDESEARLLLDRLARWVAQRMTGYPVQSSPIDAGVIEYSGISRLPEEWTREIGWRANLSPAEAAVLAHRGGRS